MTTQNLIELLSAVICPSCGYDNDISFFDPDQDGVINYVCHHCSLSDMFNLEILEDDVDEPI